MLPSFLAPLLAYAATYRKALVAAVGTATVTGVAALGPTWGAVLAAAVTVAATALAPNDTNGDGKIDAREIAEHLAGRAFDEALARVRAELPTEALPVVSSEHAAEPAREHAAA